MLMDILFEDDCALLVHDENHLQTIVKRFSEASKLLGLTISLNKTEDLLQPAPDRALLQLYITLTAPY